MVGLDNIIRKGLHLNGYGVAIQNQDYSDEVKEFLASDKQKERRFPFVNQYKALIDVLQKLNSSKPYVVLVGSPGNGKSLILDYIKDVLTEKIPIQEVSKIDPRVGKLFTSIKKRFENLGSREHIFLPNLNDPSRPYTISYTDVEKAEKDYDIADEFGTEVANHLCELLGKNKDLFRRTMSLEDFREYTNYQLEKLYGGMYHHAESLMKTLLEEKGPKDPTAAIIDIQLGKDQDSPLDVIWSFLHASDPVLLHKGILNKKEWEKLKRKVSAQKDRDNSSVDKSGHSESLVSIDILEDKYGKKLTSEYINQRFFPMLENLLSISIDDGQDPYDVFSELFEEYNAEQLDILRDSYNLGEIRNARAITEDFSISGTVYQPKIKPAQETKDYIIDGIQDIVEEFLRKDLSPKLKTYIKSVGDYFREGNREIDITLRRIFVANEVDRDFFELIKESDDEESDEEKSDHNKKKNKSKILNPQFIIPHGSGDLDIRNIMIPHVLRSLGSTKGVTYNKIQTLDHDTIFGTYHIEIEDIPPHSLIEELGSFHKGGVLEVRDAFGALVKEIVCGEDGYQGMKEASLEFLETGIMRWNVMGITYEIECPCAILGSDNSDPFMIVQNFIQERDEPGLRSRIKVVDVPQIIENTPEVRKGTLSVIQYAIDKRNRDDGTNYSFSSEAMEYLLKSTIYFGMYADLSYRDLEADVEEMLASLQEGESVVTLDTLKRKKKEDIPIGFLFHPDREDRYGGYFELPEKLVGHIHGLSVISDGPGGLVKIQSNFIQGLGPVGPETKRFEHVDIESGLAEESAFKGYQLTCNYVSQIISQAGISPKQLIENGDWKVLTYNCDNWDNWGGPSASTAVAISMVSALANDEIYKNRFITGTLNPTNGFVGEIGGTYHKGLIPFRLSQLLKKRISQIEEPNPMYFLFPVENLDDLVKDSILDPFNWQEHIVGIPVRTFAEAYYLCTCGPVIKESDIKEATVLSEKKMKDVYLRIKNIFS